MIGCARSVLFATVGADEGFDDDGVEFRPPPALDDRLWRHPAEVAGMAALTTTRNARRSPWAVGFVSVVGSAVLAGSLMFTAGGIGNEPARLGLEPLATLVPDVGGPGTARAGIVTIEVDGPAASRLGTAMVLDDGVHVITSLQLLGDNTSDAPTRIRIIDRAGVSHDGSLVAHDAMNDLAIVRATGSALTPRTATSSTSFSVGAAMTMFGGGFGTGLRQWNNVVRVTDGVLHGERVDLDGVGVLDQQMPAAAAGAAAFDAAGTYVGLVSVDLGSNITPINTKRPAAIVPAARVLASATQFLHSGTIEHGWLGVEAPSPREDPAALSVSFARGATVEQVVAGSPAGVAGVLAGDVLTRVCGSPVASITDVLSRILVTAPGTHCVIEADRGGQPWQAEAIIGQRAA